MDGLQFVTGGNRNNPGALSHIYSIESQAWTVTPTLPGLSSQVGYKRTNVGMALDRVTGLIYIYGGLEDARFSKDLAVLDTWTPDVNKMNWALATNDTILLRRFEPFVVFLPTKNQTLVFGGCDTLNSTGYVSSCVPPDSGFLISNGQTRTELSVASKLFAGAIPSTRYQSCRVVLPDGNVFIQGGKDKAASPLRDTFFADASILNVTDWTWKSVTIDGLPVEMTRAGHTCQMGANGQIVIVGGYIENNGVETFVTPNMGVIDTTTWKWTTNYTGGPLNRIWPKSCAHPGPSGDCSGSNNNNSGSNNTNDGSNNTNDGSNNTNDGSNNTNDSSGLSAGAKGGIGAGVALVILAAGGFIFWRRRRSSSSSLTLHAQKPNSSSSRTAGGHDELEKNGAKFSKPMGAPRGPAYIATSQQPTVQAMYTPPPPHAIVEDLEPASPALSTLPLYPGYNSGGGGGGSSNEGGAGSDAALAAALLQAEDEVSSSSRSPGNRKGTFSNQNDPIPFQQMPMNHVRIPSARMNQQKPQLDSYESSSTSSSTSSQNHRRPTIHTHVNNTVKPSAATSRYPAGPQSLVPEEEARIERFSPGVPVRTVTVQDFNQDGHYPPLTPTRGFGPSSILIGSSGPETPTTLAMSPLHHSTRMTYPDIIAMGAQPYPGHPAAIEGGTRESVYFGQPANINTSSIATFNSGHSNNSNNDGKGSPQTSSSRNQQMRRNLDEIAREIEIQTLQEPPKGPHALVPPSRRP
ncbi:hypothetical protein BGZ96_008427 [Linnemannia gamsii]|uniref:Galactose oxidase n=1 Tax=Linnemannia gamsii TaxID=64522 RepID=A0ABQ7KD13_9FUNG|nr:hypothetical protein BGZ96_008427 [Linnemannia gamsii]